jgi:SAM-dependent methyltransferase
MPRYSLVLSPSSNRVYTGSAPRLAVAELTALNEVAMGGALRNIEHGRPFGADAVSFVTDGALDHSCLGVVSAVSAAFVLFEHVDGGLLKPIALDALERWSDDLVTIQRYPGKTNEQFTRLLVNLALGASKGAAPFTGTRCRVLDPICGRGTTLNQAVLLGHDAVGIDFETADIDHYLSFFETWLKDKRAKHRMKAVGKKTTFEFSPDKDAERSGVTQQVVVVSGDTASAVAHIGKTSCDALAGDLPYGVQHTGRSATGAMRRSPVELLTVALPVWRSVLRPGGAMALAFNRKTLSRATLVGLIEKFSLVVVESSLGDDAFVHRVDQSIERDVIVARRT